MRALRLSFIGELGFELHIPSDNCVEVYNKLWDVGQPFGLGNVGYRSFYSMSCEKGTLSDDTAQNAFTNVIISKQSRISPLGFRP